MVANSNCELILALDLETKEDALATLERLGSSLSWVKIGLQLFTAYGPDFVREVADRGYHIFLDLKLHDIPNTVAKAVQSIAQLPVELLTLHGSGGSEMLEWAAKSAQDHAPELNLLAVTVLTSMNKEQLRALNVSAKTEDQVLHLAETSLSAGILGSFAHRSSSHRFAAASARTRSSSPPASAPQALPVMSKSAS